MSAIVDVLRDRFGPEVRVATSPLVFGESDMLVEERELCARAVEKRVKEVATGRVLARRVLAELGFPAQPLLRAPDRAPIWPEGAVGTIAHAGDLCIVAVARARDVAALGVDVEERTPLDSALFGIVLVDREARWLAGLPASLRGELAKLIFSAKECAYKAQYTFTKKMLDFHDVELSIDRDAETFEASVLPGMRGFFVLSERHVVTGLKVPASG